MSSWEEDGGNDSEFLVRLDIGNIPSREQGETIGQALRRIADLLEEYPPAEAGQLRKERFGSGGVSGHWAWSS